MARSNPPGLKVPTRQSQRVVLLQAPIQLQIPSAGSQTDRTSSQLSKVVSNKKQTDLKENGMQGKESKLVWSLKLDAEMRQATNVVFGTLDNKAWIWFFKMRIRLYNQRKKHPAGDLVEQLFARYTAEEVNRQYKVYLEAQQRVRHERIVGLQRQGLLHRTKVAEVESEDEVG